jgi:predicted nucleotidyltransferase
VPGLAAAKLGAWLDRSEWLEAKDAADLALILFWYAESSKIHDRLYDTQQGSTILVEEAADLPRAAARLLGVDVARTLGQVRTSELLDRWPGDAHTLIRELQFTGGQVWPGDHSRRRELIEALTTGLRERREAAP